MELNIDTLHKAITFVVLLVSAIFDIRSLKVPNYITIPFIFFSYAFLAMDFTYERVLGVIFSIGIVFSIWVYSLLGKRKIFENIGGADIKIILALGTLGYSYISKIIIISSLLGVTFWLIFIRRGDVRIPLVPFLFLGCTATSIYALLSL